MSRGDSQAPPHAYHPQNVKVHQAVPKRCRSFQADRVDAEKGRLQAEYNLLERKYRVALTNLTVVDRLVRCAKAHIEAYPPVAVTPHIAPEARHGHARESAVLVLSDTHIGQVVDATQTLGFGDYNFQRFAERVYFVENRVRSLLRHNVTTTIDELVVFLLGDMVHGALKHPKEIVCAMTIFDQVYAGSMVLAQALRNIAQDVPHVRVYTAVGNHPRMPDQRKMPTEQRYSNFDHFLYAMVEARLRGQPNIAFHMDRQPFCYADVKGTKIIGMHGDHLIGGDKQMGLPIHAINRQLSGLTQLYERQGLEAPHLWLMGHKHRHFALPTAKGSWLINGSFVGDDNLSLTLASSAEPMQLFFGVHPKYRKSWQYELKLAHAPESPRLPYDLPPDLVRVVA